MINFIVKIYYIVKYKINDNLIFYVILVNVLLN